MIIWASLLPAPTGEQGLLPLRRSKARLRSCHAPWLLRFPPPSLTRLTGHLAQVAKAGGSMVTSVKWAHSSLPGGVGMRMGRCSLWSPALQVMEKELSKERSHGPWHQSWTPAGQVARKAGGLGEGGILTWPGAAHVLKGRFSREP